ncbi:MAG: 50S ribosomal protein L32, partial [Streptosporangiaceae bacterium]
ITTAMPNPKRRHSKRRTSTRRAHDALSAPSLSECPNCHERKLPHRACPHCGHYRDREVMEVAEK